LMEWKYMCPIQIYGLYIGTKPTLSSYKPRYLTIFAYPNMGFPMFTITEIALRTTKGDILKPNCRVFDSVYHYGTTTGSQPLYATYNNLTDNNHDWSEESYDFAGQTFEWYDDEFTNVNEPSPLFEIDLGENYDDRPDIKDILIYTNDIHCMIAPSVIESDVNRESSEFFESIHSSSVIVELIFIETSNFETGPYEMDIYKSVFPTIIDYGSFYMPTTYFMSRDKQYRKKIPDEKVIHLSNRTQQRNKVIQLDRIQNMKNRKIRKLHVDGNVEGNVEV
jgi:hypothetical protein